MIKTKFVFQPKSTTYEFLKEYVPKNAIPKWVKRGEMDKNRKNHLVDTAEAMIMQFG